MTDSQAGRAIGGWLYVVAVFLVLTPLRLGYHVYGQSDIFSAAMWAELVSSPFDSSSVLIVFWMVEVLINALIAVAFVYAGSLFVSKKANFPKVFLRCLQFVAVFVLIDALLAAWLMPLGTPFDRSLIKEVVRSCVQLFVWWQYMRVSVRVRETFIH